jgi:hypothetical protein
VILPPETELDKLLIQTLNAGKKEARKKVRLYGPVYWGFSFKSTGGVTRDLNYVFDISTGTLGDRDGDKNFDNLQKRRAEAENGLGQNLRILFGINSGMNWRAERFVLWRSTTINSLITLIQCQLPRQTILVSPCQTGHDAMSHELGATYLREKLCRDTGQCKSRRG